MDDTAWLTATDVARLVRSGRLDRRAVPRLHIERIRRLDPRAGAFVHVDEAAVPGPGGPLAGVSLAVKDTQPVAGMPWTWGSRKWRDRVAECDAIVVSNARTAGPAIIGKTNTP